MNGAKRNLLAILSSTRTSCVLVLLLGLLTWLGTLEQVHDGLYEVQRKYFESLILFHRAGPISIPLPGGNLVMSALALNLIVGGIARLRRGWATAGVLVTHVGIGLLLVAAFVKARFSDEGHVTLFEGQSASHFQSYYRWEIAIVEDQGAGRLREHVVPQEKFSRATGDEPVTLVAADLPFVLEVTHFLPNCLALPKGPMFSVPVPVIDGVYLREEPRLVEAEGNIAGLYVTAVGTAAAGGERTTGILWGAEAHPLTIAFEGREWTVGLRKERYPMPLALRLERFTKEDHPGTSMPRSFSSDVAVIEGRSERPVEISMNQPLRAGGLVAYQASWGPSNARPGDPLFSTLAVVRNPADRLPLVACIVIAAGLILHFSRKLVGHVRSEVRRA